MDIGKQAHSKVHPLLLINMERNEVVPENLEARTHSVCSSLEVNISLRQVVIFGARADNISIWGDIC
jgi:hypothetical protein